MKNQPFFLNILLTVILSIVLLAAMLLRTFVPTLILPPLDIPNLVLLSLATLLADHYLTHGSRRSVGIPLLSMLSFGLLPWTACFADGVQAIKLGLVGGAVFTLTARLFCSILERISSGPAHRAAPIVSAFGLYLAAQGFLGLMP